MEFWEKVKKLIVPILLLIIVIGAIIGISNYQESRREPKLEVTEPKEGVETESDEVTVKGKIDNKNDQVLVNGSPAEVSDDGSFQAKVSLTEGDNMILVETITKSGKKATQSIAVKRTAKAPAARGPEEGAPAVPADPSGKPTPNGKPAEGAPEGGVQQPLVQAGPKENAVLVLGIIFTFLYFYLKSKREFSRSLSAKQSRN